MRRRSPRLQTGARVVDRRDSEWLPPIPQPFWLFEATMERGGCDFITTIS